MRNGNGVCDRTLRKSVGFCGGIGDKPFWWGMIVLFEGGGRALFMGEGVAFFFLAITLVSPEKSECLPSTS